VRVKKALHALPKISLFARVAATYESPNTCVVTLSKMTRYMGKRKVLDAFLSRVCKERVTMSSGFKIKFTECNK